MDGITLIMIEHRLRTLSVANRVMVLNSEKSSSKAAPRRSWPTPASEAYFGPRRSRR